ncbi:MAG: hypothetical protein H0W62_01735 [Chitinophagales bacterium]|nr:hypothetical protein [Chitinophagales bacterium]
MSNYLEYFEKLLTDEDTREIVFRKVDKIDRENMSKPFCERYSIMIFSCFTLFQKEADNAIQQIKQHVYELSDEKRITVFINQVFGNISMLKAKNGKWKGLEMINLNRNDHKAFKIATDNVLDYLDKQLFLEYYNYIDISNAVDEELDELNYICAFYNLYIFFNNHRTDRKCNCLKAAYDKSIYTTNVEKEFFVKKYVHYVRKWRNTQRDLGAERSEVDFIKSQINKKRFSVDDSGKRIHYFIRKFEVTLPYFSFDKEYFTENISPFFEWKNQFLKDRLEEIQIGEKESSEIQVSENIRGKVKTDLTVAQLGYLFRSLKKQGAIHFKSDTEATNFAADFFSSEKTENISPEQARKKSYVPTIKDLSGLNDLLNNMRNEILSHLSKASKLHQTKSN